MSTIRATHSGLINLFIGLLKMIFAFVFITLITRSLSVEEFGQYNLVLSIITYVVLSHYLISYWVTRELARGKESAKSAIISSGLFSTIGLIIFIIVGTSIIETSNLNFNLILLASLIVPLQFLHNILSHIAIGWKPQISSYSNLILESMKLLLALIFVFGFNWGLDGIFLALIFSFVISNAAMIYLNRKHLHSKFSFKHLRTWLSRFWIPAYPAFISIIYSFDFLIVVLLASTEVIGYYAAALAIGSFVSFSKLISVGVYPKLLGNDRGKYLNENFRLFIYFSFLFATLSIVFAKAGLFVLNPIYETISIIVVIITLRYFLFAVYDIFMTMLKGIEIIDEQPNFTIHDFLKSKLFKIPTIQLFQYVGYILGLTLSLIFIEFSNTLDLLLFWSVLALLIQIPSTVVISLWIQKEKLLQVKIFTISKYFLALIPTYFIIDFFNNTFLNYDTNLFEFTFTLLLILILGVITYLGITYAIDNNTRKLLSSIISEFKK